MLLGFKLENFEMLHGRKGRKQGMTKSCYCLKKLPKIAVCGIRWKLGGEGEIYCEYVTFGP